MMLSIPESTQKLWEAWNVRGYIIASLLVQVLLILLAPFRKQRYGILGKLLDIFIWSAYLFADWVAIGTIGFILSNQMKSSGSNHIIEVLWAPFLLLHLGGPDTITSFALEDNELWVRHLLGLPLQVGFTIYVFIISFQNNHLWIPTLLVLVAGIIKYAERNRAFYMASFDHLGETWVASEWGDEIPVPLQFKTVDNGLGNNREKSILWSAVHHFGSIKRILVGPLLSLNQYSDIRETFSQLEKADDVLKIMEIELSLLYEVLHTKFPVIDCLKGCIFRAISVVCSVGALLSFRFLKGHYGELGLFDIRLTYGLLIGAVFMDVISLLWIFLSDWFFISHWQWWQRWQLLLQWMESIFNKWPRWSKRVSQVDFITYHMKDSRSWLKWIVNHFYLRSWLEAKRGFSCLSCKSFKPEVWKFIFDEVRETNRNLIEKMKDLSKTVLEPKEVWECSSALVLKNFNKSDQKQITNITRGLGYSECIVTWHIATELCFHEEASGSTDEENIKHRDRSKLLSDYMLYLAVMQPAMMAAVSTNWKSVFQATLEQTKDFAPRGSFSNRQDVIKKILRHQSTDGNEPEEKFKKSVLCIASNLAKQLKGSKTERVPWEAISKVWVQLMCFAAINCKPTIHAQQPSKGGELLTFVWLYMNHMGLGIHFSTQSFS